MAALDYKTFTFDEWSAFTFPQWGEFVFEPVSDDAQRVLYVAAAQVFAAGAEQGAVDSNSGAVFAAGFEQGDVFGPVDAASVFNAGNE